MVSQNIASFDREVLMGEFVSQNKQKKTQYLKKVEALSRMKHTLANIQIRENTGKLERYPTMRLQKIISEQKEKKQKLREQEILTFSPSKISHQESDLDKSPIRGEMSFR